METNPWRSELSSSDAMRLQWSGNNQDPVSDEIIFVYPLLNYLDFFYNHTYTYSHSFLVVIYVSCYT